jgi:hypothetical protein
MTDRTEPPPQPKDDGDPPRAVKLRPDGDEVLDFAIERLVARRSAIPVLRHGDLRALVRRYRIFPGLGASFVECAPEAAFRQGLRQLAAMRTVGVEMITYVAAFTFPDVMAAVIEAMDAHVSPTDDEATPNDEDEPADVPAVELTDETLPEFICATVAARMGTAHVRTELESIRRAPPRPPTRRRPAPQRRATPRPLALPAARPVETLDVPEVTPIDLQPDDPVRDTPPHVDTAVNEAGSASKALEAPTDPAPIDPAPIDPAPIDPAPIDPAPIDPEPVAAVTGDFADAGNAPTGMVPVEATAATPTPASSTAAPEATALDHEAGGDPPAIEVAPNAVVEATPDPAGIAHAAATWAVPHPLDLAQIVAGLEALPVEAYDWAAVGNLAVALHALHLTRLDEQRRLDVQRLGTSVRDVVSRFKETFDAWGLTTTGNAATWSVDAVRPEDAARIANLLETLSEAFATWQSLHDEGEPSVLARREFHRAGIRRAENLIATTYAEVHVALGPRFTNDLAPTVANDPAAWMSRTVITQLLHEGHFGTAARMLRSGDPALADAADLAETMQRRMEFEFTRPYSCARAIAGRVTISLATRNAAMRLESDLGALVLQPPTQSVTHRQLAELFWNADVRLRQRHLSDFLGRMWNGIELALRLRVELFAGRRLADAPVGLAWWAALDPESPVRRVASTSRYLPAFEKDGLTSVRGCLAILQGLEEDAHERGDWVEHDRLHDARVAVCALEPMKQLRNDSLVAHGTSAVSDEDFTLALAKNPALRLELGIPPSMTGAPEVAWIYRGVMENLGVSLDDENPLLAWGRLLADAIRDP